MSNRSLLAVVITACVLVIGVCISGALWESLDNSQIMVIQNPVTGQLTWHQTGGIKWQGFGTVTKYQKRGQFWFSSKEDQGKPDEDAIKTRFNDGAHAFISGSFSFDMPTDEKLLTQIHTKYGSQFALEQQLIRTVAEKSVYMTGPLMSSAESYASRRNDLLNFIDDQMNRGVYRTESMDEKTKDPMTGQEKTVKVVKLIKSSNGEYLREDKSPLAEFGIRTFNLSFNEVSYEKAVEEQIAAQQKAVMDVQTAIANAKKSEQDALTTAKKGEADAAKAKWEQEVIKTREVTKAEQEKKVAETAAEQRKNVAAFDLETARLQKDREIALGEGESKRKQLVMAADGALEKKIEAWVKVNELYAKAIAEYKGQWVPTIQQGVSNGSSNGATALMDLLTAKTAKDLALDLSIPAAAKK